MSGMGSGMLVEDLEDSLEAGTLSQQHRSHQLQTTSTSGSGSHATPKQEEYRQAHGTGVAAYASSGEQGGGAGFGAGAGGYSSAGAADESQYESQDSENSALERFRSSSGRATNTTDEASGSSSAANEQRAMLSAGAGHSTAASGVKVPPAGVCSRVAAKFSAGWDYVLNAGHEGAITSIIATAADFTPLSSCAKRGACTWLFSAGADGVIRRWHAGVGQCVCQCSLTASGGERLDPDTGVLRPGVSHMEIASGQHVHIGTSMCSCTLASRRQSPWLLYASSGIGDNIDVFEPATGHRIMQLHTQHPTPIETFIVLPDAGVIVAGCSDGVVVEMPLIPDMSETAAPLRKVVCRSGAITSITRVLPQQRWQPSTQQGRFMLQRASTSRSMQSNAQSPPDERSSASAPRSSAEQLSDPDGSASGSGSGSEMTNPTALFSPQSAASSSVPGFVTADSDVGTEAGAGGISRRQLPSRRNLDRSQRVVVATSNGRLHELDCETWNSRSLRLKFDSPICSLQMLEDSDAEGTPRILSTSSRRAGAGLGAGSGDSDKSLILVVACVNGRIHLVQLHSRVTLSVVSTGHKPLLATSITSNGSAVACVGSTHVPRSHSTSASAKSTLRAASLVDLNRRQQSTRIDFDPYATRGDLVSRSVEQRLLPRRQAAMTTACLTHDDSLVWVGDTDGSIVAYDIASRRPVRRLGPAHGHRWAMVAWLAVLFLQLLSYNMAFMAPATSMTGVLFAFRWLPAPATSGAAATTPLLAPLLDRFTTRFVLLAMLATASIVITQSSCMSRLAKRQHTARREALALATGDTESLGSHDYSYAALVTQRRAWGFLSQLARLTAWIAATIGFLPIVDTLAAPLACISRTSGGALTGTVTTSVLLVDASIECASAGHVFMAAIGVVLLLLFTPTVARLATVSADATLLRPPGLYEIEDIAAAAASSGCCNKARCRRMRKHLGARVWDGHVIWGDAMSNGSNAAYLVLVYGLVLMVLGVSIGAAAGSPEVQAVSAAVIMTAVWLVNTFHPALVHPTSCALWAALSSAGSATALQALFQAFNLKLPDLVGPGVVVAFLLGSLLGADSKRLAHTWWQLLADQDEAARLYPSRRKSWRGTWAKVTPLAGLRVNTRQSGSLTMKPSPRHNSPSRGSMHKSSSTRSMHKSSSTRSMRKSSSTRSLRSKGGRREPRDRGRSRDRDDRSEKRPHRSGSTGSLHERERNDSVFSGAGSVRSSRSRRSVRSTRSTRSMRSVRSERSMRSGRSHRSRRDRDNDEERE